MTAGALSGVTTITTSGNVTVGGNLYAENILDSSGTKLIHKATNGDVHIGQNSMVFSDASNNNGTDVMYSTAGKVQIGNSTSDTTTVVGAFKCSRPYQ